MVRKGIRYIVAFTTAAVMPFSASSASSGQGFPQRSITIVVPYSVGGTTDIVARLVASQIADGLGHPLVVENRVGAGGLIGWNAVARAMPDGYTLLTTEMSFTIAPGLLPELPFDGYKDFAHIITVAAAPNVLVVTPHLPVKTVQEFIALAKAKPGAMYYGSGGNGTNTHLGAELFNSAAGIKLVHVPYKGAGQVLTDLMAGQVQALVTSLSTVLPHIRSGKLRALVVASESRSPLLPDVPSAKDANLPGFHMDFWVGFAAPAGTSQSVVKTLNQTIAAAVNSPNGRHRFAELGLTPVTDTPEQATEKVESEIKRWSHVVKSAGVKPD